MEAKSTLRRAQAEVSCWRNRAQTSSVAFQKFEGSCLHAFVAGMYSLLLKLWSRNVMEMAIWSRALCRCSLVWTKSSVSEPLSQTLKALSHLYLIVGEGEWKMPWDSVWCYTLWGEKNMKGRRTDVSVLRCCIVFCFALTRHSRFCYIFAALKVYTLQAFPWTRTQWNVIQLSFIIAVTANTSFLLVCLFGFCFLFSEETISSCCVLIAGREEDILLFATTLKDSSMFLFGGYPCSTH